MRMGTGTMNAYSHDRLGRGRPAQYMTKTVMATYQIPKVRGGFLLAKRIVEG